MSEGTKFPHCQPMPGGVPTGDLEEPGPLSLPSGTGLSPASHEVKGPVSRRVRRDCRAGGPI